MTSLDDVLSLGRNFSSKDAEFLEWLDEETSRLEKSFDLRLVKRYVKSDPELKSLGLDVKDARKIVTTFCKLRARLASSVLRQAYFTFCKNDEDLKSSFFHYLIEPNCTFTDELLTNAALKAADDYASSSLRKNAHVNVSFFEKAASSIVDFCSKLFWEALSQNDALKNLGSRVLVEKFNNVLASVLAELFPKTDDEKALSRTLSFLEEAKPFFLIALLHAKTEADLRQFSFGLIVDCGLRNVNRFFRDDAVEFLTYVSREVRNFLEVQNAARKRCVSLDLTDVFTFPFFKFFGLTTEWLDLVEARTKSSNNTWWISYEPLLCDFVSRVWQAKKEGTPLGKLNASKKAYEVVRDFLKFLVDERKVFFAPYLDKDDQLILLNKAPMHFSKVFPLVVESVTKAFFATSEEDAEASLRKLESQVQLFYETTSFLREVDDDVLASTVNLTHFVDVNQEPEVLSYLRSFLIGIALRGLFKVEPGLSQLTEKSETSRSILVRGLLTKWLNRLLLEEGIKREHRLSSDLWLSDLLSEVFVEEVERAKKECVDRLRRDFGVKPNLFL